MMSDVRIVLVNPSHPGNIGATARAMKNMGLSDLYLVQPEQFPHSSATARAAGADSLLAAATVVDCLTDALVGCNLIFATSARSRSLSWPVCNPRECAERIAQQADRQTAIVFGREKSGLTNEELACCHYHVHIPTDPQFSSLNLAAAVQVITYEIRMAIKPDLPEAVGEVDELATADELAGFYQHLQTLLTDLQFLDPKQPKMLMQRLQRLFNRTHLEKKEINILRGILSTVDKRVNRS